MEFTALIANLGKYAAGIVAETPLAFPTTTEQVQKALQTIGVDGLKYEEVIVKEYSIGIAGVAPLLGEYAHIDELNYLAKRLECLSPEDLKKFAAAVRHGEYVCSVQDLINLAYAKISGHGFRILAEAMEADLPYRLQCPALLICGEKDHAGSCIRYNKAWHERTGIPIRWLKNAGHNSNTDSPQMVNQILDAFLQKIKEQNP